MRERELPTHPLDTQLPQPSDLRGEHVGEVICLMIYRQVGSKLVRCIDVSDSVEGVGGSAHGYNICHVIISETLSKRGTIP